MASFSADPTPTFSSASSSNQLLDLLAGATRRVTSPPSSPSRSQPAPRPKPVSAAAASPPSATSASATTLAPAPTSGSAHPSASGLSDSSSSSIQPGSYFNLPTSRSRDPRKNRAPSTSSGSSSDAFLSLQHLLANTAISVSTPSRPPQPQTSPASASPAIITPYTSTASQPTSSRSREAEGRLSVVIQDAIARALPASASSAPTTAATASIDVEKLALSLAENMSDKVSQALASSVGDATNETLANGIQSSVAGALPLELEKLLRGPEIRDHLSRSISESLMPAVQSVAMETIGNVVAPHFEEVMMEVSQRVESAVASELSVLRKVMLKDQSEALLATVETNKAVAAGMGELLGKLIDLSKRNADLEKLVQSMAADLARKPKPDTAAAAQNGASPSAPATPLPIAASKPLEEAKPVNVAVRDGPLEAPTTPSRRSKKHNQAVEATDKPKVATQSPLSASTVDVHAAKAILPDRIAIVGAGPVGCLAALAFAQRGCKVDIYEARQDPRTQEAMAKSSQRSINLAISTRGLTGLRSVAMVGLGRDALTGREKDLADVVLDEAVPMRARMVHTVTQHGRSGRSDQRSVVSQQSQAYGANGECINSVDRSRLNNLLLQHASQHPSIEVHFDCRLQKIDFEYNSRTGSQRWADAEGDLLEQQKALAAAAAPTQRKGPKNGQAGGQFQQAPRAQQPGASDRVRLDFDVHVNSKNKHTVARYAGLVIGCDGAHSAVRSAMGSMVRMGYSHEYIDNGYVELSIPARTPLGSGSRTRGNGGLNGSAGGHDAWQLDPNHLHIWPRREFMLIALPNRDGSFTSTLFAPFHIFRDHLSSRCDILTFFAEHFPDAVELIGSDRLVEDLLARRPSPLGSVKCKPYHYRDRAILLGDAAHAMLPFYGQGLNCGFEDVRVLLEKVDAAAAEAAERGQAKPQSNNGKGEMTIHHYSQGSRDDNGLGSGTSTPTPLHRALDSYTATRHADLLSITHLASENYREMASSVLSAGYLLRKKLDGWLMAILPRSMWQSLYMMVTFSNIGYAEVVKREKRQQRIVRDGVVLGVLTGMGVVGWSVWRSREVWRSVLVEVGEAVGRGWRKEVA